MSTASQDNEFVTPTGVLWDDPEPGKTWLVSLMGVTIIAALVIAMSVIYFRSEQGEVDVKVIEPEYMALKDLQAKQAALLAGSGTYTVEVGGSPVERRRIPVTEAMSMLAANPALAVPGKAPRAAVPGPTAAPPAAAPATDAPPKP
jgi:hypothetical protein